MKLHTVISSLRDAPWITASRVSVYPRIFVTAYLCTYLLWLLAFHGLSRNGVAIGADFINSWAGSQLALTGHPEQVYNFAKIHSAEQVALGSRDVKVFGWYYPPTFLLLVLPFALVPYLWALGGWTLATLSAYLAALRKIAPYNQTIWLALAFPGAWINLTNGQNGFLTGALFAAGLVYLEEQPILAGVFFGLLVFKPHLGIFIPVVLIASRRWQCLAGAVASSTGFIALSLLAFGTQTWRAFFHSISQTSYLVLDRGLIPYADQQSVFAMMRLWGFPVRISYGVQAVAALAVAMALVRLWTGKHSYRLKAAALAIGALLATPYLFDYDLTLLGVGIAWLVVEGLENRFLPFEKITLLLAWLAPLADRNIATYCRIPMSPLLNIALFALITIHATLSESGIGGSVDANGPESTTGAENSMVRQT